MITLQDGEIADAIQQYIERMGLVALVNTMAWYPDGDGDMKLEIDVKAKEQK